MADTQQTKLTDQTLTLEADGVGRISLIQSDGYDRWLATQTQDVQSWLAACQFDPKPGKTAVFQDQGAVAAVVIAGEESLTSLAAARAALPAQTFQVDFPDGIDQDLALLGFVLDAYRFDRYLSEPASPSARLLVTQAQLDQLAPIVESHVLVRDLINTPAEDMGPSELQAAAEAVAKAHSAKFDVAIGDILQSDFPAIHAVGRASDDAPRLLTIEWGKSEHPLVCLVGKGVCYDTGGLDIKPSQYMRNMKKDMGGSAHVLGLANWIMSANLPVRLMVLVPAVENAIAGNAYRPGDVVATRKGLSVEIDNTDAEGRVVLSDALALASEHEPDLIVDFATLTGAARVAVGTEMICYFTNQDALSDDLMTQSQRYEDNAWRLPLHQPYFKLLKSNIADMANSAAGGYAGAITASLFLEKFVGEGIDWCHVDLMAYNTASSPARPEGGEAQGLRAMFNMIQQRYA